MVMDCGWRENCRRFSCPRAAIFATLRFSAILLLLACLTFALRAQTSVPAHADANCASRYRIQQRLVDGFTFETYSHGEEFPACLTVHRDGKLIYKRLEDVRSFSLGQPAQPQYGIPAVVNGADLTSRGNSNMIVTSYSGGAHCCTTLYLFELNPQFRLLTTVYLGDRDLAHFAKDPVDGKFYLHSADNTFAYWHTSFAESPAPSVVLRWVEDNPGHGSFRLALDKMQGHEPSAKEWKKNFVEPAHQAFEPGEAYADPLSGTYSVGPGLWSSMLDLIYSERSLLAWKLIDEVWPTSKSGKDKFLSDFCSQLSKSPYWPELQPTLKEPPQACRTALSKAKG